MEAFPGYYGQFICLHFARFLNEPITSPEQQSAYEEVIAFLDNTPSLQLTEELESFLIENTKHINTKNILNMLEDMEQILEHPNEFLSENKVIIDQYLAYKQSEEYRSSPVYKIQSIFKEFNETSGYYDIFIPAIQKLSNSYSKYCEKLECVNEKLLVQYTDYENVNFFQDIEK